MLLESEVKMSKLKNIAAGGQTNEDGISSNNRVFDGGQQSTINHNSRSLKTTRSLKRADGFDIEGHNSLKREDGTLVD